MSPRESTRILAIVLATVSIFSCDVGQGVKTLGKKAVGGTGTASSDADSFSVTLAYRNPDEATATGRRTVLIQGIRGVSSANLVNACGSTGANCTCDFYRSATDSSPVTSSTVGISQQNNSFSCVVPTSISDTDISNNVIQYVKLRRTDVADKNTGLIAVKHTLTLDDVLGSTLTRTKVRGIFRYSCSRTFFEGEGVSAGQISCVAGQHLGVIAATYQFYTFKSGEDSNLPGSDAAFPADICKRNNFLKIQCTGNTPELRYGFYKESADPFVVGIQMTRAPEGDNLTANYGFAALPDSAGNCPTGLIKVRPWVAQPSSIVPTGPNCPVDGCPSSFVNTNNSLNLTVVEASQPANFIVTRQPNATPCAGSGANAGDCTSATFGGVTQAQSVAFTSLTPVVCAIPPSLLTGLF